MKDLGQTSKIASAMVALLTIFLGYGFVHGTLQSPRPYSPEASLRIPEATHKVESRLWQDPFEPFELDTNQPVPSPAEAGYVSGYFLPAPPMSTNGSADERNTLWNNIAERSTNSDMPVTILGVMLEGGSYAEDKEVRLRVRYAVEVALLTEELGPEDRTHIYTNSVLLTREDNGKHQQISRYAYEWFRNSADHCQVCVLWLNEDDFADRPALRLGSLLTNIPSLQAPGTNVSFYLIGPRSSDTLQALAESGTNASANFSNLASVAKRGRFQILSPEATASVHEPNSGDSDDHLIRDELKETFGTNIFHNWIATDQQIALLVSRELNNRLDRSTADSNNVVVLLSEQDTYYGRKLADEWIDALVRNQVCTDSNRVWQFAYLRGLDGSKPQAQMPDQPPSPDAAPETALETAMTQQQEGQRADGDAQMDYVIRLAEFLKQKDHDLKVQARGRIIAFGFTGSDAYDKLILLQELRHRFPEAVFFTTDLDASLWTAKGIKYTSDLLVGSAYPVNPFIDQITTQPVSEQFAPFRDVYQTAIFRACSRVVDVEEGNTNTLEADSRVLLGGLYKIGRHGPVGLTIRGIKRAYPEAYALNLRWPCILMALTAFGVALIFFASPNGGIRRPQINQSCSDSKPVRQAEEKEVSRQISRELVLVGIATIFFIGLLTEGVQYVAWKIATIPGEEPWNMSEGVSIWASEYLRMLAVVGMIFFFFIATRRRWYHRQRLWEDYFRETGEADKTWESFYARCRQRWQLSLDPAVEHDFLENDARHLWEKSGRLSGNDVANWMRAEAELKQERNVNLINGWTPPFVEVCHAGVSEVCIDAAALFRCYLNLGSGLKRLLRICLYVPVYFLLAFSMIYYLQDIPTFLLIRGHYSHLFDAVMILTSFLSTLLVLFYVLDTAFLTRRVLDYITRHPTCWPEPLLQNSSARYGVSPRHLDGLLDVDFAAVQTGEIGSLMFGPILLLLILLLSRSPCFDDWTWPTGLIVIFAINFLAVGICWWVVRRATEHVRTEALERVNAALLSVRNSPAGTFEVFESVTTGRPKPFPVNKENYLANLKALRKRIKEERRGAFAVWFQDPTYLAVFVPSGVSGIITLISSFLVNR